MRLKRLKIHKYRIIEPGTEVVFNDGFNLLIGKNGTGKTTLLNLLAMIFGGNFSQLANEDFDLEYDFEGAGGSLGVSLRNQADTGPGGFVHGAGREPDTGPRRVASVEPQQVTFRYALGMMFRSAGEQGADDFRLEAGNASTTIRYKDEQEQRWDIIVSPFHRDNNFMHFVFSNQRSKRLREVVSMQEQTLPRGLERFDESTEFLKKILETASVGIHQYFDEYDHSNRYTVSTSVLSTVEVSRRILESLQGPEVATMSIAKSELRFLDRTVDALGYRDASMMVDLKGSTYFGADGAHLHFSLLEYGNFRFLFVKRDGSRISHDQLSFGEKRLLGFHYYLDAYPQVLLADELANGMHHDMVDECLDATGDRQAFLATQNPLLLDHMGFSSAEQMKTSFVLCRCEMKNDREQMVFGHMTDAQATELFADYQIGIQHVNEVLRMRGLW